MPWQAEYGAKCRTAAAALEAVRSGDRVGVQSGCGTPSTLVNALVARAPELHDIDVVHHCPLQVQFSCMADGLSAATGASPGKLNLRIEESSASGLKTSVKDRERGRTLIFTLKPEFVQSILDLPGDRLNAEGRRVAALPDEAIFHVTESK